jgi:hypothetical protein
MLLFVLERRRRALCVILLEVIHTIGDRLNAGGVGD